MHAESKSGSTEHGVASGRMNVRSWFGGEALLVACSTTELGADWSLAHWLARRWDGMEMRGCEGKKEEPGMLVPTMDVFFLISFILLYHVCILSLKTNYVVLAEPARRVSSQPAIHQ